MILPVSWAVLLEMFRPAFRRRSTFAVFTVLATGMVAQTGRRSVVGIVVRLPFCTAPVCLPVLFRLWAGKGSASPVELAGELLSLIAAQFPGRQVHGGRGCRLSRQATAGARDHMDNPVTGQRRVVWPGAFTHR